MEKNIPGKGTASCAKALGVAEPVILKEQPGGLCGWSKELKQERAEL